MTTPEQRISRIFSDMAAVLYPGEVFRELAPPTPSVMSMRAALAYKYNPTVRYTVELFRDPGATHGGAQGIIRVSVRTTSVALLTELRRFYRLWAETERQYGFPGESTVEDDVFRRPILHRTSPAARDTHTSGGEERAGAMLAAYVSLMNSGMKLCFREPDDRAASARALRAVRRLPCRKPRGRVAARRKHRHGSFPKITYPVRGGILIYEYRKTDTENHRSPAWRFGTPRQRTATPPWRRSICCMPC